MTRRQYSREFKISAVKLVNEQDYSVVKAARSLGIDPSSVRQWLAKFGPEVQPAATTEASLRIEVRKLRRQNAELLMERDILKKRRLTLPRSRHEVHLDPRELRGIRGAADVPGVGATDTYPVWTQVLEPPDPPH
jgi:transposase